MSVRRDDLVLRLDRPWPVPLDHQPEQSFSARIPAAEVAPGEQLPDELSGLRGLADDAAR
jgi:hypothetical protein